MTELGPLLGRLTSSPNQSAPAEALLSPVRLELVTGIFERAGWSAAWEQAVSQAGRTISSEIESRLRAAAQVSRYPARRLNQELPTVEDRSVLLARLASAGIQYEEAITRVEDPTQIRRASGELEVAWDQLVVTASEELSRWDLRATRIRSWRRPWTPFVLATAVVLALAIWVGLVLGGYLRSPSWMRPLADWVWSL